MMIVRQIIGFLLSGVSLMLILGISLSTDKERGLIIFSLLLLSLGLFLILKYPRNSEQCKEIKNNKIKELKYTNSHIWAAHQAGLPLSQGSQCELEYVDDKFIFKGAGNSFELLFEKITDICVKTDNEIQTQYVSSIGGAVAGAVVFGPLGAIVGGRAKKKSTSYITYYLIFTYKKDDSISYISFEIVNTLDVSKAFRWASDFTTNYINNHNVTVVL